VTDHEGSTNGPWATRRPQPFFQQAVELGITFWDTANVYGIGSSEEIVGRAIQKYSRRQDIVLATKVHITMHDGPGGSGLSARPSSSKSTPR
jgi:1-deoxyxylulose-5-phosphate synthase